MKLNKFFKYGVFCNDGDNEGHNGDDKDESGGGGGSVTLEDLQKTIAELKSENKTIKERLTIETSKHTRLMDEAKKAKNERRDRETEAARKAGDFEALYTSSESERQKLHDELTTIKQGIGNEKKRSTAKDIAISAGASGTNIELLTPFVEKRLKYDDSGSMTVTDTGGNPTVLTQDDLINEIKGSEKYFPLLDGNKSTGGGSQGGGNGGGSTTKTITRAELDALSHTDRSEFFKSGGTLTD